MPSDCAIARTFKIIDPSLKRPPTQQWEQASTAMSRIIWMAINMALFPATP